MKTKFLISAFLVTVLLAKANANELEIEKIWVATADKECQSACKQPEAISVVLVDAYQFLPENCNTLCSCDMQVNLPDNTECVSEIRIGLLGPTRISGKCVSGKCVIPPTTKRR